RGPGPPRPPLRRRPGKGGRWVGRWWKPVRRHRPISSKSKAQSSKEIPSTRLQNASRHEAMNSRRVRGGGSGFRVPGSGLGVAPEKLGTRNSELGTELECPGASLEL